MKKKQERQKYNIGKNIREFRLAHDWTQDKIVAKPELLGIHMSRGTYLPIE